MKVSRLDTSETKWKKLLHIAIDPDMSQGMGYIGLVHPNDMQGDPYLNGPSVDVTRAPVVVFHGAGMLLHRLNINISERHIAPRLELLAAIPMLGADIVTQLRVPPSMSLIRSEDVPRLHDKLCEIYLQMVDPPVVVTK